MSFPTIHQIGFSGGKGKYKKESDEKSRLR